MKAGAPTLELQPARPGVEQWYREHGPRCYGLAVRIIGDRMLAADVVQNVFEALVRRPDTYDSSRGSVGTLLMTMTHHKAVDLIRYRRAHSVCELPGDVATLVDEADTPDIAVIHTEEQRAVLVALQRLQHAEREVLTLAYFGGYTQSQIARRLGVPLGTVKGRTKAALTKMRSYLPSTCPDECTR